MADIKGAIHKVADLKSAMQEVRVRLADTKGHFESGMKEIREQITEYGDKMGAGIRLLATMVDAHYAVAGTAALDNSLRAALLTKMRPLSRHMRDRLFEGYGPLATVAAKIDLAYALEIIPKEIYDQLKKINKIRVVCAHSPEITTFSHPKIVPLLDALELDTSMTDIRSHFEWAN
jgi:hypothetical protein